MPYWTKVFKRLLYVIFVLIGLCITFKLAVFLHAFLIAFIIYLLMEPAIKWVMKKTKATRKTSSIILFFYSFCNNIRLVNMGNNNIIFRSIKFVTRLK